LFYFNFVKSNVIFWENLHMAVSATVGKDESLAKITRIAATAEWASVGGILLLVGAGIYQLFDRSHLTRFFPRDLSVDLAGIPETTLIIANATALVPGCLYILAFWQAMKLFRLYRTGPIFAPAIPAILVRLGYLVLAAAATGVLARTLVILVVTMGNPPGQRHLAIGIGTEDILSLIIGLLVCAFSLVAKEAQRHAEENKGFI
jgi:hypothetical protein